MSLVTVPLPNIITNGSLGSAAPVMADFNYIASQVNANAALKGGEWQPLADTSTYVSGTFVGIFRVAGDQTAKVTIGIRVRALVGTAYVYGTVTAVSFGGGNTTITLNIANAPFLSAAMTSVAYGLIGSVNGSLPYKTNFCTKQSTTVIPSSSLVPLGNSAVAVNDVLGEWTGVLGAHVAYFTPAQSGNYEGKVRGYLDANSANPTLGDLMQLQYALSFTTPTTQFSFFNWPFATGVSTSKVMCSGGVQLALTAGVPIQLQLQIPFVSNLVGMLWTGTVAWRRIP